MGLPRPTVQESSHERFENVVQFCKGFWHCTSGLWRRIKLTSLHELVNYTVKWAIPSSWSFCKWYPSHFETHWNQPFTTSHPFRPWQVSTAHEEMLEELTQQGWIIESLKQTYRKRHTNTLIPMSEELARTESVNLKSGARLWSHLRHEICSQPAGVEFCLCCAPALWHWANSLAFNPRFPNCNRTALWLWWRD